MMSRKQNIISDNSRDILNALLDVEHDDNIPWTLKDYQTILEHQLNTPLSVEFERFSQLSGWTLSDMDEELSSCPYQTFLALLQHPSPKIDHLKWVKEYAKAAVVDGIDLPRDVARVIYILAILRAHASQNAWITSMESAEIRAEAYRCLTFTWLPNDAQELLRSSLGSLH